MAKRKPKSKAHNSNWIQLKSVLWDNYRNKGAYDWNSKKFNELVSSTYEAIGGISPKKHPGVLLVAKKIEKKALKKKKSKPKRNDNWIRLKSILWQDYKDEGLYDWNSKKFNELVSSTYEAIERKDPDKVQRIGLIAKGIEDSILNEVIARTYQITYYEIGKTLEAFRDDPTYSGYVVQTDFKTDEFEDERFNVEDFEYEGSQFQQLVRKIDDERSTTPTASPPPKITVEVIPGKKLIKMYIGEPKEEAPAEPRAPWEKPLKAKKKVPAYKEIMATPASVKELKEERSRNDTQIKSLVERLALEKKLIMPLLTKSGTGFDDFIKESTRNISEWTKALRKLEKENADIKKDLSKAGKGFLAKKRKGSKGK